MYINQSITITGFGEPAFDRAIQNMLGLYAEFYQYAPTNAIKPWTPRSILVAESEYPAFTFSNPLFMTKKAMHEQGDLTEVVIDDSLDPHHHLSARKGM